MQLYGPGCELYPAGLSGSTHRATHLHTSSRSGDLSIFVLSISIYLSIHVHKQPVLHKYLLYICPYICANPYIIHILSIYRYSSVYLNHLFLYFICLLIYLSVSIYLHVSSLVDLSLYDILIASYLFIYSYLSINVSISVSTGP